MKHAFLSLRQKRLGTEKDSPIEKRFGVTFYGDEDECKAAALAFKEAKEEFPQIEEGNEDTVRLQFFAILNWFALNEWIPAGDVSGERIYYKA